MTSAVIVLLLWMTAWCCARGSTIRWTAPAGGRWPQPDNWEGQKVPGPEDDVIIELVDFEEKFRSLGCWWDSSTRAIPTLEGTDPRLDGHYQTRVNATDKCFQVARSRGFSVFAVQYGGECLGSANGHNTYNRYGASSSCRGDGEGWYRASEVYQIKAFPITVRVDGNTEVRNLHTFPNITLEVVSSLTVNGNMQVDGHLTLYASNSNEGITVGNTARVEGSFLWMTGKFSSSAQGQLHIKEKMQMKAHSQYRRLDARLSGTDLYIHGEATIEDESIYSGTVYLSDGAKLIVTEGATLDITDVISLLKENTGTLLNNGSLKIHSTGTVTVAPTIYSNGDVQVLKGAFSCTGSSTWQDTIWVSIGATLKLSGGVHTLQQASMLLGSGKLEVGSGVTVLSKDVQVKDIVVSGGTLDLYTASSELAVAKIDVASRGVFNIHSHKNSSDWLTLHVPEVIVRSNYYDRETATLNCERNLQTERLHMTPGRYQTGVLLKVMGDVVVTERWNWNGGTIQARGPVTVKGPLLIEGEASGTAAVPELYLNGPVTTRGTQTIDINHGGTIVNPADNVFSIRGNLNLRGNGRFQNYGEVKVEQPSPGTASISLSSFDNFGRTTVSGTPGSGLSISINHGLTGTYHVTENNVLIIAGSSTHVGRVLKDAVLTGGGTLQVNGPEVGFKSIQVSDVSITAGTVYIGSEQYQRIPSLKVTRGLVVLDESSSTTEIDDLTVTSGEVTFNRPTIIQDVEIRSGTLSGDSDITVNGTFVWTRGTLSGRLGSRMTITGKMHVAPSGTLNLNRNLVLKGKSDWVTTNLNLVLTRVFEISPGASVSIHGGGMTFTSSSSDENGALLNYGDLIIDAPYQDLRINTQFRNYAAIRIQHGNLLLQRSSVMAGAMINSTDKSKIVISGGSHEITTSGTIGIQEWQHTLEINSGTLWSKDIIWSTINVKGGDGHLDLSAGGSASMDSLSVTGGSLDITSTTPNSAAPTLTVHNSITVTNGQMKLLGANCRVKHVTISHQSARIEIERNFDIEDTFHWDAGTLAGTAFADCEISRTSVSGTLTLTGDGARYLKTQSMFIHGGGQWFGQGQLRLDSSAELVITDGATFKHHGGGTYSSQDNLARVVNRGTYELSPHSDVNMDVKFQNSGQLYLPDTATLSFRADAQLRGQLRADKGSLLHLVEGSHVLIDEDSTFRGKLSSMSASVAFYSNGSVEDIEVGGGQTRLLSQHSSMRVLKLSVNGGHLTVEPSRVANSQTELSVDNVEVVSGTLELNVQTEVGHLSQKGGSIRGSSDITAEEFEWSGGSVIGELGSQILVEHLECLGAGTKVLQKRSLVLQDSGTFVGDAGGVIDIKGHGNFVIAKDAKLVATAAVTIQSDLGVFENRGMLTNALQSSGKVLTVNGHFRNTGTVKCLDDTIMKVSGTGKWEGAMTTGSNATLEIAGGHHLFLSSFEVNGTGKLVVSSGSVSMQTCSISAAVMRISAPVYVHGEDHCFIHSLQVTGNGVFISNSATSVGQVQQNGGVVRALSSLAVTEYDLAGGTLQSHNVTEVDRLQWSYGTVTGGKLYIGVVTLAQVRDKIASRATIVVSKICIWAEGFDQTLGLQENSVLVIAQQATMEVQSIATLSSETSDSYQGRLENYGQINFKQTFTSSAAFINFGNVSVSEGTLTVTKKSENSGYIGIGRTSEVKLGDHFSHPSSVIEGDGKLTLTQGTVRLSTDTLKQKILHVTGAFVTIALPSGHAFSAQEVMITGGQADFVGNKGDKFELESLTIAGGLVKIHNPCNISQLTMTGGTLYIMAPTDITAFDFFAGQLVGLSDLGYLTVGTLILHNQKNKDDTGKILQSVLVDIHQQVHWLSPTKDTISMQDGSKIRLLSNCETTLQGQLEFQGSSEIIENYGILRVYGSDETLSHKKASILIEAHFNNIGTVWVQETSMISLQTTAHITGSMTAHKNSTVEFVNHHSITPQNIQGGRLAVQNSNLWIPSKSTFTSLNIKSGGHINFVSNATDPVHDSFIGEVNLKTGSVTFASDITIAVLEITGGAVKSTSPNGIIQTQQMTFQEDSEPSTIQNCHVTAGDVRFVGSTVTMMTSSLQIKQSGLALSSVQVDMSNSSVLVDDGTTLAVNHKMTFRKTGMGDSTLEVAGQILVEGHQFVSSAAVVLRATGNFTVTKDFSELDIHISSRSTGLFNINCSYPTFTVRGTGDLVLDKGSFIGPNATINLHGGHTVMTTGIEHQLLENSGLRITLQDTGMMTINSSEFGETLTQFTVREVTLKSLSSKIFLSEATPKVQKMIVIEGQVHGDAEFDTVILQSNLRLVECNLDIDHLIIRGGKNNDKEIQACKIKILASIVLETDATISMSKESVLQLAPSAIFTMDNVLEITASNVDSEASWFINEGRITVSVRAGMEATIGAKFNHSGELVIENGQLTMSNDSFIQGRLQVGTGSRLTLSAGVHRIEKGSSCLVQGKLLVENAAFAEIDSDDIIIESTTSYGTVSLRGETCISGLKLADGHFEVIGNTGLGALDMMAGTLSVQGDVTVNGPVKWQSGTIQLAAGSSLTVNGDFIQAISDGQLENQGGTFIISPANPCSAHTDCTSCQGAGDCSWYPTANLCVQNAIAGSPTCSARDCNQKLACSNFGTTEACSSQLNCTWCLPSDMCVQHEQCPPAAAFWTNSAGGDWNTASNWFNDTTPGESSDAFLTGLPENYEVRITAPVSLQYLEVGSQCDHSFSQGCDTTQTLTVQRDLQVGRLLVRRNARLILSGDNLIIGRGLTVEGTLEWRKGTISGDGDVNIMGTLTMPPDCYGCYKNLQVPLENYGRITLQNTIHALTMSSHVNITNVGEILIKSNREINGGTIYNEGFIYSTTPTAIINSNIVQSGNLVLQQSRLQLGGNVKFSGINNADEGSELLLKSGIYTFSFGSTVPPSLTLDGGTTIINTTTNPIRQLYLKNSATLRSDNEIQVDNVFLEKGSLLGQGDYQINTFSWREGNIEGTKSISVTREMTFLDDRYYYQRKTMVGSTISLDGRSVVQGSQATLTMSRNASFEVTTSGEIHVPPSTTLSLRCSDGTCSIMNHGSVDVIGTLVITADLSSKGRVSMDGRVDLSGNSNFETGHIWIGTSGTLHLAGNEKRFSMDELVGINVHGTLSIGDGALTVSSQNIEYLNNIHCSGGSVQFTNTTNLQTIGTVYARNSQITLQTGNTAGLSIVKIDGRYRGEIILASPTIVSDIVLQENSDPGATVRLDSPKHEYKVLNSISLNEGKHKIEGTVDETGTKPTLYVVGQMILQHYHRDFYFQNVDVSIGGTLSHTCRDNYNRGVYLTDGSTLIVEKSGRAEIGGCNWLHSGSLPTSFTNNGDLIFNDDPTSIRTTFVQHGAMCTTANKNLDLYGQSVLQGNVTIGKNAAVNFRGGLQHHIFSDLMMDDSSTLNVLDGNTILNVSTNDLLLSKIYVDSQGGRLLLLSRSDVGSVNRLEMRRGSIQVGISQLTTDEIYLTRGEISGNAAQVWTRKLTLHDTYVSSSVRVANLTVSEKLLISKSYPSWSRQITIDSFVTILHSATFVAVTRFIIYGDGEILNEGKFLIDSNDDQWLDIRLRFVNYGHLQVTNRLVLNNGGSNHGKIHLLHASKLYFRSTKVYNLTNAGEIFGSGTIYMDTGDPVVYLGSKDDSMESSGKDIGLVVTRGKCYADFSQAQSLVQRISISIGSIEITASANNPPQIAEVNFLPDYNQNTFFTCKTGTSMSIGKLTLRQYYSSGHFGHGCGVVTSNMIWYSGIINRPAYLNVIGHLDIKYGRGYKRIIGTKMSITATAVAEADSTILMMDGSKIDIKGSFSTYGNLRFQKEGSGVPQLVISGHVRLLQRDKSMTVASGVSVVNYGTIEVLHGTLSISSTECLNGSFVVAKDALIQFNSGVTQLGSDCGFLASGLSIEGNSRLELVDTGNIWQHITITSGTLVLTPDSNITVDTLTVNGNVQISGRVRVRKFNLNTAGNMEVNGLVVVTEEMVWSRGNLMSNQIQVDGNLYLSSRYNTKYLLSGTLVASGTVAAIDSQTLQMQGDAVLELQGTMGVHDYLRFSGSGQNAFLNAGIIKIQAGLNEYGLIVDVNFNSPGVVVVESGKMKVGHSNRDVRSTISGSLTVKEQAILEMGYGELTFANQSMLNISGTMAIEYAQVQVYSTESMVTINNIKITRSGTLETTAKDVMVHTAEICSGTLWIHRNAKIDTLQICGGSLRPGRSVNVTELLITSGDVFSSSGRPKVVARRMGWGGGRVWANEDTTAMTIQVTERLHVYGPSHKYGDYDTVIRVDGQFTMISVGYMYMSRNALIQLNADSTASLHHGNIRTQYNPPGRFTNMGDITIGEYSKAATVELLVVFQMLGKIAVKQGQIRIASGGRFSGSTELLIGGRAEVTGGTLNATSGSISGPGDLYVSGGILSLDGGEVASPITITGGTLQVTNENSVTTRGTVRIQGGTLNVDGYLECLQDVQHVSGSLSGTGIVKLGNQSKIHVMSTQSSDRRTTSVRSLQIFGLLEASSSLEVRSPGVVRNEEDGQIQMTRSGAITGTGRVENYGRLSTGNMHPGVDASISSTFENFWVVKPDNSSLIIEPRSTATLKISSRVLGGVTTWKNWVTIGGISKGSVVIQGHCYVGQATVFSGHITWESGSISLQEDQCSTRSYDSSTLMRSACSEKYVLNTGDITIDTSSDKTISTGVDLVNKGNIRWLLGKMVVDGSVKNLPGGKLEITDTSNTDRIWQNSGNTLENNGILLLTSARCLFQDRYGSRRGLLRNKGRLSLRNESHLQIDTLTSGGGAAALFEMSSESTVTASQINVESGTAYLQGQVNGRVVVSGGKLNPGGANVIGKLSIEGSLFMSDTSVLEVDLVSPLPSPVSDTLTVSSDLELHGRLAVSWNPDGPTLNDMDSFPIIAYGGSCRIDGLVTVSLDDNVNFNTTCVDSFLTVTVLR